MLAYSRKLICMGTFKINKLLWWASLFSAWERSECNLIHKVTFLFFPLGEVANMGMVFFLCALCKKISLKCVLGWLQDAFSLGLQHTGARQFQLPFGVSPPPACRESGLVNPLSSGSEHFLLNCQSNAYPSCNFQAGCLRIFSSMYGAALFARSWATRCSQGFQRKEHTGSG